MITKSLNLQYVVLLDILAVGLIYFTPVFAHWVSVPIYKFEPMRLVLLFNLLFVGNKKNAFLMAFTLPLFSFIVGSHPVFIKAVIMALELVSNVYIYIRLKDRINCGLAMFLSIALSKIVYYTAKYICILTGLMSSTMIGTSLWIQLIVAIIISGTFYYSQNKQNRV